MRWNIKGADSETGGDVHVVIEASNEKDALFIAKGRGIFVSELNPILEPPVEQVLQTPIEQPRITLQELQQYRYNSALEAVSMVIGIITLAAWLIPILGIPLSLIGLMFAGVSGKSRMDGISVAMGLNIVTLILGVGNSIIGAMIGAGVFSN